MEKPFKSRAGYVVVRCSPSSLKTDNERIDKGEIDGFDVNPHNKWDGSPRDLYMITDKVRALGFPFADETGLTEDFLLHYKCLERLFVAESTLPLEFESPTLKELVIGLNRRMVLGNLPKVEYLTLHNVNRPVDPPSWPNLPSLSYLSMVHGGLQDLHGLERYLTLAHLDISYLKRLDSIAVLTELPIKHLWIDACPKVSDWAEVLPALKALNSLRILNCGVLKDLAFLLNLNLREFRFGRTKVLDGDLSLLDRIPIVAFDDARHYNRKAKDFAWHDPNPDYPM
jgi:hypothetical protein